MLLLYNITTIFKGGLLSQLDLEILVKLGISTVLGLIIGLEREIKRKPVGLKTSLVISIVSCLLTIVSIESAYTFPKNDAVNITMDPLRLAAQIVSGIGFLGAGVILRRGNDSISGLTTAALIWGAAGIGIAVGAGFYIEAIAGVTLLIISVELIPILVSLIGPKQLRQKEIRLHVIVHEKKKIDDLIKAVNEQKMAIKNIRIKDLETGDHLVKLRITVNFKRKTTDVYYSISEIEGVTSVEVESLQ
ncbi:MgtC/SapB family protein [Cytobacillus sp. Hz8]|uniref:MgtC/SapB family protein n=1 Tax=Cytobacillus sp. Hz8 TaxID=3347168 RepID=UPI0035DFA3B5